MKSKFLNEISQRGFYNDCTDKDTLDELLAKGEKEKKPVVAYIGFDCTAPSLHVGSLMQIMILRWFQKCGHKPIVLMGGGTTKVGDPSGKDESRKLLTDEDIKKNMEGIKKVFSKYIEFENTSTSHSGLDPESKKDSASSAECDLNSTKAIMVNNDDWLKNLKYIDFLRDCGRHFSVNRMLSMDSVRLRLEREQELTFLEFNYMILQAYDFVELAKNYNCRLQIGGSDQWGNIVNGTELNRRLSAHNKTKEEKLFGLTTPLLATSSGAKMGKTAAGAVWLNEDMFKPYDFWQYWRNTEDADVGRFLKLFTDLSMAEIAELEKLQGADSNQAKIKLANEVTKLCHGEDAARNAEETARKTFVEGKAGGDLPVYEVEKKRLEEGIPTYLLFKEAGLATSGGEARKLIEGGGARRNDEKIPDANDKTNISHLVAGKIKLSAGKKRHAIVKVK